MTPLRLPTALLWDMDGLLVDTEPLWTVGEVELAERLGATWTHEIKVQVVGTRMDVAVPTMLRMLGVDDSPGAVERESAWLLARMVELFEQRLVVKKGALALLDAAVEADVPQALVSSSYRPLVDACLTQLDLRDDGRRRFTTSLAGDEVHDGKPAPEPYLTAAVRLGVRPEDCVVLEDSPSGVAAGLAAGCAVLAVPEVTALPPAPAGARRRVVTSLADVDLDDLATLLRRQEDGLRREPD